MFFNNNTIEQLDKLISEVTEPITRNILERIVVIMKSFTIITLLKTLGIKNKNEVCGFLSKHTVEIEDKSLLMEFYQIKEDEIQDAKDESDVSVLCDLLCDNESPEITDIKRRLDCLELKIDKNNSLTTPRQTGFLRPTSPVITLGNKSVDSHVRTEISNTKKVLEDEIANLQNQIDNLKRSSLSIPQSPREHEKKISRTSSKKLIEYEKEEKKEDKKLRKSQTKKDEEERKKLLKEEEEKKKATKRESKLTKKELEELEKQKKTEEEEEKRKQKEEEERKKKEELKKQKEEEERVKLKKEAEAKMQQEMRREAFNEDEQLIDLGTQMEILQEWSGLLNCEILFDSDNDDAENDNMQFNEKVMFKENCFFINFDKKGNVFGAFMKENIGLLDEDVDDDQHFIFSLKKENKNCPKRWFIKSGKEGGIKLFSNNDCLYQIGNVNFGCFGVSKINLRRNVCCTLSEEYEGISDLDLVGTNWKFFSLERVVVVHMF
ncbi:hypothetical protein, conserved [Entamoeba dispar SAW760]|uniref:TLDc domain-containing protein n=1 Tax=Entamoeba dispar (strain ATCC PRA-260 / SAW760) TaxID=370354 RepID=B0EE77_ENTDS|nr:uncharacterized protein EDI_171560 [Entamoeba dispar SAW760]EDR27156.1 hypothetical protein, conserved [Entamoeba dispar SAW760]|eukprot:EDR27156.1 hypothetical protein, conserved [Entamoeba dispar SAW760]